MTTYQSKYPELSFYVGSAEHKFSAGIYVAHTDEEIEALNRLADAIADPEAKEDETAAEAPKRPRKPKASEAI